MKPVDGKVGKDMLKLVQIPASFDSLEFIFWGINDASLALMKFFIAVAAAAAATVIPPCVVGSFVCTPSRARPANSWMASAKMNLRRGEYMSASLHHTRFSTLEVAELCFNARVHL